LRGSPGTFAVFETKNGAANCCTGGRAKPVVLNTGFGSCLSSYEGGIFCTGLAAERGSTVEDEELALDLRD
jgi:hypothetical protein